MTIIVRNNILCAVRDLIPLNLLIILCGSAAGLCPSIAGAQTLRRPRPENPGLALHQYNLIGYIVWSTMYQRSKGVYFHLVQPF